MITKDSIESAYCFFHQKYRVYEASASAGQRDDIEYAISLYVNDMSRDLLDTLAGGKEDFLMAHSHFDDDMRCAIAALDKMKNSLK